MSERSTPTEVLRRAPRVQPRLVAPAGIVRAGSAAASAPVPPSATPRPATTLRIERLVLDGPALDSRQAGQLRTALEQELGDLLHRQPLAPASQSQDRLRGPPLRTVPGSPAGLGLAIARSLHAGLAGTGALPE